MKKNILWLLLMCLLPSILFFDPVQQVAAQTQAEEVPKTQLPAPKVIRSSLDNIVLQGLLTKEQSDKFFEQLNIAKTSAAHQEIVAADLKEKLTDLVNEHIINEAQAFIVLQEICKSMPDGFPEIPDFAAVYSQKGKIVNKANQNYMGHRSNESAIIVANNGELTLTSSIIKTSGSSSFESYSNFAGLNAAVLAQAGATINLFGSTLETTGDGAHTIFATGANSLINLANSRLNTSGNSSCGLAATAKGMIRAENIDISTVGAASPALAADRTGGTVTVHNGKIKTAGADSPGIYSIGNITVADSSLTADKAEAAIIEGRNSLTLNNTLISGAKSWGVLMFENYAGQLEQGLASFIMNGGSLTAKEGPAFYVTNVDGNITLTDAAITASSKKLIEVSAGRWGQKGANGGKLNFSAIRENLAGSIFCDNISTLAITLKDHTTFTGTINDVRTAGSVLLVLDNTSTWKVTGDSYLSSLTNADTTLSNIDDNGFTVYYDSRAAASQWLGGKTYKLKNGGSLTPSPKL